MSMASSRFLPVALLLLFALTKGAFVSAADPPHVAAYRRKNTSSTIRPRYSFARPWNRISTMSTKPFKTSAAI